MSGVVFRLPVEVVGAAALLDLLQPYLAALDEPVSSRATPEDVVQITSTKLPDGKVH
jgi:hypothetical protein